MPDAQAHSRVSGWSCQLSAPYGSDAIAPGSWKNVRRIDYEATLLTKLHFAAVLKDAVFQLAFTTWTTKFAGRLLLQRSLVLALRVLPVQSEPTTEFVEISYSQTHGLLAVLRPEHRRHPLKRLDLGNLAVPGFAGSPIDWHRILFVPIDYLRGQRFAPLRISLNHFGRVDVARHFMSRVSLVGLHGRL